MQPDQNKIVLGTVQFGLDYGINNSEGKPPKERVFKILEAAWHAGIRVLDTAEVYGNAQQLIGEFHRRSGKAFLVNSKFKTSGSAIGVQLQQTLKELSVKSLATYFYHAFTDFAQKDNAMDELQKLKSEGLIRAVGVSVYENHEFERAVAHPDVDVIQLPFNLLDNLSQRGALMEKASISGKKLQVRSVFLQGLFFKDNSTLPLKLQPLGPYLNELQELAMSQSLKMEELAMGYALAQPLINEVVIGVDSIEQLEQNMRLTSLQLEPELLHKMDGIRVEEQELLYPKNWN